jgi:hypothetical protein
MFQTSSSFKKLRTARVVLPTEIAVHTATLLSGEEEERNTTAALRVVVAISVITYVKRQAFD